MIRRSSLFGVALAIFAGALGSPSEAAAQGYLYEAPSYYLAPPVMLYGPLYPASPVIVERPVSLYPPVVAAPVLPIVPPATVRYNYHRSAWSPYRVPHRERYRVDVDLPNGLEYEYRYRRVGNRVYIREGWDD